MPYFPPAGGGSYPGSYPIVNADVDAAAAIAKSKLAALGIVNADVDAGAAIAYSKLNLAVSILSTDLADNAVTLPKIVAGAVTGSKIANDTITDAKINSAAAIAQSKIANLVTDLAAKLTSPEGGLKVIRGIVSGAGAALEGTGYTPAKTATGVYTITFDVPFSDIPAVVPMVRQSSGARFIHLTSAVTTSVATIRCATPADAAQDNDFHFVAVGPA